VVVLSHDVFNEHSGTVIAVAITSQEPRVERLGKKLGRLAPEEVERIVEGLDEIVAG